MLLRTAGSAGLVDVKAHAGGRLAHLKSQKTGWLIGIVSKSRFPDLRSKSNLHDAATLLQLGTCHDGVSTGRRSRGGRRVE